MRRLVRAALALLACWMYLGSAQAEAIRARDDGGVEVALRAPARRVVTLAPHLTELVYAAGGAASLVAADLASDYPAAAADLARIGDASGLDLERIVALRPDLVLGWQSGNKPSDIARLRQLGLLVFLSEPRRLDDIAHTLRVLGLMLGTGSVADERAEAFEARLRTLRARAAGLRPVSVFFEVWHQPLITVNADHLISDVVALCGAHNALGALPVLAPVVSLEDVLARDPEVIFAAGLPSGALAGWSRFPGLRAVQRHQIFEIASDSLTRATPRVLDGAEQLCRRIEAARESN
ncbi:MAG TPA: cobalamin-binding protein [Burkholderiales bacterium]|nr:cobalamin-binding protein [Burkholderiales bacterium]